MKLFNTFLKPSESVMVSLATGAMVFGIYQYSLPTVAEVHATEPYNTNLEASRKKAMWTSGAVVGGMFLLTRDPNVFMVGGLSFLALEWSHRHANATHPNTGKMVKKTAIDALNQGYSIDGLGAGDTPEYSQEYYG
jgi:hypothetical protein